MISKDDVQYLSAWINSSPGQSVINHLRSSPPSCPVPITSDMQPHHVQINYGFQEGCKAMLDKLISLSSFTRDDEEPETTPHLIDTRNH